MYLHFWEWAALRNSVACFAVSKWRQLASYSRRCQTHATVTILVAASGPPRTKRFPRSRTLLGRYRNDGNIVCENLLHVYRPLLALSHNRNCTLCLGSASWHRLYGACFWSACLSLIFYELPVLAAKFVEGVVHILASPWSRAWWQFSNSRKQTKSVVQ
jgi:hypothetical protein